MDILSIVIIVFLVLELLNVLMLYNTPGTKKGNGLGVFKAYEKSKEDPEIYEFVSYLINWVAGTKLIFIVLLIGVIITGSPSTKVFSVIALIFSIMTFFSRLYPSIKKMDKDNLIAPTGYSKTLAIMIATFITVFAISLGIYLFNIGLGV